MPSPTPPPDAPRRASAAPELRRLLLRMVLAVVAVHAVAIGLYHALEIERRPQRTRNVFVVAWTLATLPVVLVGMTSIRKVRLRARHARRRAP